jgi:hypothetical protein
VKLLFYLALIIAVGLGPFVLFKQPWAIRLWGKIKLFLVVYVFVLVVATILRLAFGWNDIYG